MLFGNMKFGFRGLDEDFVWEPMDKIKVAGRAVGRGQPCFNIAEIGVNHRGDIDAAKSLLREAKRIGADIAKTMFFKTSEMQSRYVPKPEYHKKTVGEEEDIAETHGKLELTYNEAEELMELSRKLDIPLFFTPHSGFNALDDLMKLKAPVIKIGSGDATFIPFLDYAAQKKLPMLVSTGLCNLSEVEDAVKTIMYYNENLLLFHCTSNYPLKPENVNMRAMKTMMDAFRVPVGYSSHEPAPGSDVCYIAVGMGARSIERHFIDERRPADPDGANSLTVEEFKNMIETIRQIEKASDGNFGEEFVLSDEFRDVTNMDKNFIETVLGSPIKHCTEPEKEIRVAGRKSIIAKRSIPSGTKLAADMLTYKRPGPSLQNDMQKGIAPKYINWTVGRTTKRAIGEDEQLSLTDLV